MPNIVSELPCIIENSTHNGGVGKRYLLSVNGGGMTGGAINTTATEIGEAEQFRLCFDSTTDGELVAKIQTYNGEFLRLKTFMSNPDPGNTKPIHADAVNPSIWEQFTLCMLDTGKYAFRTYDAHYLTTRDTAPANDPVVALEANESKASWFTIIPNSYQDPIHLPPTQQREYQLASTDYEETICYVEDYVRALRGKELVDADLRTTGSRMHIWAGPDYITGIVIEYPRLGLLLGDAGIAEDEVQEYVLDLWPQEFREDKGYICQVTVGIYKGHVVALRMHSDIGGLVNSFCCPAFQGTKLEAESVTYYIEQPYSLVGLIPAVGRDEKGAVNKLELLFKAENGLGPTAPFSVAQYQSNTLLDLQVKSSETALKLTCEPGRLLFEQDCVFLSGEKNILDIDSVYVHELLIEGGQNASQLYGALTTDFNKADFPEGAFLEVFGTDNTYLECELSDDHVILNEGDSIHCFAEHRPENGTYTFVLGKTGATTCCLEIQYLADRFDEAEELCGLHTVPDLLPSEDAVYPYFRRPLYKIAELLCENGSGEQGGKQLRGVSSMLGGLAYYLVATFGVSSKVALLVAGGVVGVAIAAAVGGCIYAGIQIYNNVTVSEQSRRSLKKLKGTQDDRHKILQSVLKNYKHDSALDPQKRDSRWIHYDEIPDQIACGLIIFQNVRVSGVQYSMSKDCIKSFEKGMNRFIEVISRCANYYVQCKWKSEIVTKLIDIPTSGGGQSYYLSYSDVLPYTGRKFPAKQYPYLFAVYPGNYNYGGLTFQGVDSAQAYVALNAQQGNKSLDVDYVTSLFVHEFVHVREAIKNILDVRFPSPDDAKGTENQRKDAYQETDGGMHHYMKYYLDILKAAVRYDGNQAICYAGVFSQMWKIHPGFVVLGVYRIRNLKSSTYLAADIANKKIIEDSSAALQERLNWLVCCSKNNTVRILPWADVSLYWDVRGADPRGPIGLAVQQYHPQYRCAQEFQIIEENGYARLVSTVADPTDPSKQFSVQWYNNELRLQKSAQNDMQLWTLEEVVV